ncbi:kinase-like domain-containing protein [Crepidotus variabilis]|uniref:Kinase-like domain-containing protein n=1 Tax=Crepidotus variabilis TaxID=179855 RepID=A0A9P6ECD0_9AGAR|nr:kinase-like domain-containing protein [Crepidotus variabilis]
MESSDGNSFAPFAQLIADEKSWIKGALIGPGSLGKVYLGMNASHGLLMAVKQVELEPAADHGSPHEHIQDEEQGSEKRLSSTKVLALEREIMERLTSFEHQNLVQYLYTSREEDSGSQFLNIFMEYIAGGSVSALLRDYGAFEEPLAKNFTSQILQGLKYLHEMGLIHRNIKSSNILVGNSGGVKISDFGMSEFKKVDDQHSVFWMAPEVVKQSANITAKADIWSVGCLVVEMLAGKRPWAELTPLQAIFQIGSGVIPTMPSDSPAQVTDFLQQTLRIDQETRPEVNTLLLEAWINKDTSEATE